MIPDTYKQSTVNSLSFPWIVVFASFERIVPAIHPRWKEMTPMGLSDRFAMEFSPIIQPLEKSLSDGV
ncbi:MAG: hypothetical protein K2J18_07100, partial [Paramuribaculum sp.]|nr:hypothetical protein [Paramuribaculum sp.]